MKVFLSVFSFSNFIGFMDSEHCYIVLLGEVTRVLKSTISDFLGQQVSNSKLIRQKINNLINSTERLAVHLNIQ